MKVGELKAVLAGCRDDAEVLIEIYEESFLGSSTTQRTAKAVRCGGWLDRGALVISNRKEQR